MNEDTLTNWQQRGWSPFLVRSVSSYGVLLKIKGFLKKRDFELYAQGAPHSEIINQFDLLPFWIKTEGLSGYYSIATFLEKEIVFKASKDARDFDYPKSKIKRHNI